MKPRYWAYSLACIGVQNLLYYYNVMASLGDYFSDIFSGNKLESELPPETRALKVDRHSYDPHKAWQSKRQSQVHKKVKPVDPDTPMSEEKIRFVCISDTHTHLEKSGRLKIPNGDVLLHAGDFTVYGTPDEVQIVNDYLGTLPHKHKVLIAGNHDMTFDLDFIKLKRRTWIWELTKENYEDRLEAYGVKTVHDMLTNCTYLQDSLIEIDGIKIYGSPWIPGSNNWGFSLRRGRPCLEKWKNIPLDTDILITHGPPVGHGDNCNVGRLAQLFDNSAENHLGCVDLLNVIQKLVKPKYHLFGHIHQGYGITTDGTTTFINAATCDENYAPINPPIVFDISLPPGYTKEGNLTWIIKNEPWKTKTRNCRINDDVDDDGILFENEHPSLNPDENGENEEERFVLENINPNTNRKNDDDSLAYDLKHFNVLTDMKDEPNNSDDGIVFKS